MAPVLGFGIYSTGAYARSAHNPADDPTRGRAVRGPTIELPSWWCEASAGDFRNLDFILADIGLGPFDVAGIPNLYSLLPHVDKLERHSNRLRRLHSRGKKPVTCRLKEEARSSSDPIEQSHHDSPWPPDVLEALLSFPKEVFFLNESTAWPPDCPRIFGPVLWRERVCKGLHQLWSSLGFVR